MGELPSQRAAHALQAMAEAIRLAGAPLIVPETIPDEVTLAWATHLSEHIESGGWYLMAMAREEVGVLFDSERDRDLRRWLDALSPEHRARTLNHWKGIVADLRIAAIRRGEEVAE